MGLHKYANEAVFPLSNVAETL